MKPISRTLSIASAVCCAALLLAPSRASSDDLATFLGKYNPTDPCDWSGVYFGLNVGGTWNHFDFGEQRTDVDLAQQFYQLLEGDDDGGGDDGEVTGEENAFITFFGSGHSATEARAIGGIQSGFNLQFGHFVFGAEGSFVGNSSETSKRSEGFQENEIFLFTLEQNVTAETLFKSERTAETVWNGFIGGRIGWCWNRILFYGTGGAAFAGVEFNSRQLADTAFFGFIGDGDGEALAAHTKTRNIASKVAVQPQQGFFLGEIVNKWSRPESDVLSGYYGGVGTEYKLTNNVSVALEYRHVDWGDSDGHFATGPNHGPLFPSDVNFGLTGDQVVFKVNIMVAHFNPFH
jgi:opacity protein-like surface antigen